MRTRLATAALAAGVLAATAGAAGPIGGTLYGDRISISANGAAAVYQGQDAEGFGAFLADTASGAVTRLTYRVENGERRGANGSRPSISADGRKILVASRGLGAEAERRPDQLWLVDPGGNATRVATGLPETPRDLNMAAGAGAAVFNTSLAEPYHVRFGAAPRQIAQRGTYLSISRDGGKVAYWWDFDVYVWDAATGKTTLVSKDAAGRELDGATYPQISANGRYVSFAGYVSGQKQSHGKGNLSYIQAYRKDLATGKLLQVSRDTKGRDAGENVTWTALSADGSRVLFVTAAKLTAEDRDASPDAYVYDVPAGELTFVETGGAPTHIVLSGDGSTVAWNSGGRLFVEKLGGGASCERTPQARTADCVEVKAVKLTFERRLVQARQEVGGRARSLKAQRLAIDKTVDEYRKQLNAAHLDYVAATRDVGRINASIAALKKAIPSVGTAAGRAAFQAQLSTLEGLVAKLDRDRRLALSKSQSAAEVLADAYGRRSIVDTQLFNVAPQLAVLDFEFTGVTVTADGGDPVYRTTLESPWGEVHELNEAIDSIERSLSAFDSQKKAAFQAFVEAHRAATDRLERLVSTIMNVAYGKAAVSGAIHVLDLALALRNGGLAGVGLEVMKKSAEAIYENLKEDGEDDAAVPELGPPVESVFREALADTFTSKKLADTFESRLVKDFAIGTSVDAVGATLGVDFFENVNEPWLKQIREHASPGASPFSLKPAKLSAEVVKKRKKLQRIEQQLESLKEGPGLKLGDVAIEYVKDFAEDFLKGALDKVEQRAWQEYASLDAAARIQFSRYQATTEAYWATERLRGKMLARKAKLLASWDPDNAQKRVVELSFPRPKELRVILDIRRGLSEAKALPLQVLVNGQVAKQIRFTEYSVPGSVFKDDTKLTIEVR